MQQAEEALNIMQRKDAELRIATGPWFAPAPALKPATKPSAKSRSRKGVSKPTIVLDEMCQPCNDSVHPLLVGGLPPCGVHNPFTHSPKDPECPGCQEAKIVKPHSRRKKGAKLDDRPKPTKFADLFTCDTCIANRNGVAHGGSAYCQVLYDVGTKFVMAYPQINKTSDEAVLSFEHFSGCNRPKMFYSDNAPELIKAARDLGWIHDTSTPELSQTNGVVERQVGIVEEGSRTVSIRRWL